MGKTQILLAQQRMWLNNLRLLQRRTAVSEPEFVERSPLLRIRKLKHETLARDSRCKKNDDNRERSITKKTKAATAAALQGRATPKLLRFCPQLRATNTYSLAALHSWRFRAYFMRDSKPTPLYEHWPYTRPQNLYKTIGQSFQIT